MAVIMDLGPSSYILLGFRYLIVVYFGPLGRDLAGAGTTAKDGINECGMPIA